MLSLTTLCPFVLVSTSLNFFPHGFYLAYLTFCEIHACTNHYLVVSLNSSSCILVATILHEIHLCKRMQFISLLSFLLSSRKWLYLLLQSTKAIGVYWCHLCSVSSCNQVGFTFRHHSSLSSTKPFPIWFSYRCHIENVESFDEILQLVCNLMSILRVSKKLEQRNYCFLSWEFLSLWWWYSSPIMGTII